MANDNAVDQRSAELELPSNYQNPLTATGAEMAHFSKQVACIMKLAALKVIQNREKRNMSTEKEMQDFYIKSNLCNKREEEFEALFAKLDRDTQKKAACKILENLERSIINQKNPEIRQLNMKESIRYKRNCLWE